MARGYMHKNINCLRGELAFNFVFQSCFIPVLKLHLSQNRKAKVVCHEPAYLHPPFVST